MDVDEFSFSTLSLDNQFFTIFIWVMLEITYYTNFWISTDATVIHLFSLWAPSDTIYSQQIRSCYISNLIIFCSTNCFHLFKLVWFPRGIPLDKTRKWKKKHYKNKNKRIRILDVIKLTISIGRNLKRDWNYPKIHK